jgi:hypothetical protein
MSGKLTHKEMMINLEEAYLSVDRVYFSLVDEEDLEQCKACSEAIYDFIVYMERNKK